MPPYGSIGEAVAKHWMIHKRHIEGFGVWQQVQAAALSQTDAFLLAADSVGELISNLFLLKPGYIPEAWTQKIDKILQDAQFEVEKHLKKEQIKQDPNIKDGFVAERRIDTEDAVKVVAEWGRLEEESKQKSVPKGSRRPPRG